MRMKEQFADDRPSASGPSDAGKIRLDSSVLQKPEESYSSLTDTNHVNLFTDKYDKEVHKAQVNKEEESSLLRNALFQEDEDAGSGEWETVQSQLFLSNVKQVKREEPGKTDGSMGMAIAAAGIVLTLFFLVVFTVFDKRRKKRQENAAHTYVYE